MEMEVFVVNEPSCMTCGTPKSQGGCNCHTAPTVNCPAPPVVNVPTVPQPLASQPALAPQFVPAPVAGDLVANIVANGQNSQSWDQLFRQDAEARRQRNARPVRNQQQLPGAQQAASVQNVAGEAPLPLVDAARYGW